MDSEGPDAAGSSITRTRLTEFESIQCPSNTALDCALG